MKRYIRISLLLPLLVICLQSCSKGIDLKNKYVWEDNHFSINYPSSWKRVDAEESGKLRFTGNSASVDSAYQEEKMKFAVDVYKLPRQLSTREVCNQNVKEIKSDPRFENVKILELKEVKLDGHDGMMLYFAADISGYKMCALQYFVVIGRDFYILAGGAVSKSMSQKMKDFYVAMANTAKFNV